MANMALPGDILTSRLSDLGGPLRLEANVVTGEMSASVLRIMLSVVTNISGT